MIPPNLVQLDQFSTKSMAHSTTKKGTLYPEYRMFVDDLLSAIPCYLNNACHFIVSSVELINILISYSGQITNPDLPPRTSWDKMVDRAVRPERLSLGVKFLNRNSEMTVDDYEVAHLLELLNTEWSIGQKGFTTIMAAVFISNVYTAIITCTWLKCPLHHLIHAMKISIHNNYHHLAHTTSHFNKNFEGRDKQWLNPERNVFACWIFPNHSILKAVWQ